MSISSVKISCETIARNGNDSLEITTIGEKLYIHYGKRDRDIFMVSRADLLQALSILEIIGK